MGCRLKEKCDEPKPVIQRDPRALSFPGDVLWEHEPTVHVVRSGGSVGLESKDRRRASRDLRSQPLVGQHRDPHPAAVGQKRGGQSERLPNSERTAEGARGFHRACRSGERTGAPNCPAGGGSSGSSGRSNPLAGLAAPRPLTVLRPVHGLPPRRHRPAERPPPPKAASPCVLRKLALAVETGTAAGMQERPLPSRRGWAPAPLPCDPCRPPEG